MTGDDESWMNRRNFTYALFTGASATGAYFFGDDIWDLLEPDEDGNGGAGTPTPDDGYGTPTPDDLPITPYDPTETYDTPEDGTTYTTTPGPDPLDTWNEAVPHGCTLSSSERHWLVAQVDSHQGMNGDSFFDYVESGQVYLKRDGNELRMLVDENADGQYDQGYSVPDVC